MSFTGRTERAWVMAQLTPLCGGRVWKTRVPDADRLKFEENGYVDVYIVVRFSKPFAATRGRNVGSGEQGQPHILQFTVQVFGADADEVEATLEQIDLRLTGKRPSSTANEIKSTGGFAYARPATDQRPSRVEEAGFYRVTVNH